MKNNVANIIFTYKFG